MKINKTRLREIVAEEVQEAFGLDLLGRPKTEPTADPTNVLDNIRALWPATAAGHPEKIKALKDMYRLLDNALIGSKHQPGLLSVKEGDLAEITLEDEKVIFAEMIRETAQSLSQTHNTLTPVQQEAYENLLMQAASSLSDRRENNRHR